MFIIAVILGGLALAALAAGLLRPKTDAYKDASPGRRISTVASPILGVLAVICLATTMVYAQDPGEAKVLKNWSGAVEG